MNPREEDRLEEPDDEGHDQQGNPGLRLGEPITPHGHRELGKPEYQPDHHRLREPVEADSEGLQVPPPQPDLIDDRAHDTDHETAGKREEEPPYVVGGEHHERQAEQGNRHRIQGNHRKQVTPID